MLNKIILFSLKNRLFILLAAIVLLVAGLYNANNMDIDVFPDLTAPTVVVMTDAYGMAAEEVERLVTFPIESAVNGATDVRRVRSASMQGYSFVWVEFDWGADIFNARQIVNEKLVSVVEAMPEGLSPMLAPQSSIMGEIMYIGLQADTTSMMDLRTIADWVVKPAILSAGGVSQVTVIGGDYKQYQVLANPDLMLYHDVSMDELEAVCRIMNKNSSGGILREYGNEYVVRGMARTYDLEALGKSVIKLRSGQPITVGDVAEVCVGKEVEMGNASQNGKPAVILSVAKQPNINTIKVTNTITAKLDELEKTLPADVRLDSKIFRQADFISTSVNNVQRALIEGAVLVIVILFVFLGSFRSTLISVIAIPLSLLGTIIVLKLLGLNINTMSLGGMCIAIGSLVDDAIIDVENVYKRLRQNHHKAAEKKQPAIKTVFEASKEIRASILNATLIIIVAFTPLFFLSGMEGRMLQPLGIAYIVSLFMSLVVAMTLTPLLCSTMLSSDRYLDKKEKDSWLTQKLTAIYSSSLVWALSHKKPILCSAIALFAISITLALFMGRSFLPEFNEGSLTISAICKPGVSLEETTKTGTIIERELLDIPEVSSTARRTGRGELDEHSQTTNSSEIDVNFELKDRKREEFMDDVRHRLADIPGVVTTVGQPLGHRIDHMLSGTRANIAIKIFGYDLNRLYTLGNKIKSSIAGIDGLVDISVEQQTETPQLQIRANRDMLSRYGITVEQFNRFIEQAFSGEAIGEIYEQERSFDLVLKLNKDYTESMDGMRAALIDIPSTGGKIPLEEVAEIVSTGGPNSISRENVQRKMVVSANVAGRDLQSVVDDIKAEIAAGIALPEGYRIEYGGQFESAANAAQTLLITSIIAIFIIFVLLYQEFRNITLAAIILINLPLALIGGVFAIFFTSNIISIPSIIGFITLFGIATRNGILLVSNYSGLQRKGIDINESVRKGSVDRLSPILMTALTAALALIPLVFNGDKAGNEIQSPMAIVILGGLLTSTLLNIYIIPIVYTLLTKKPSK